MLWDCSLWWSQLQIPFFFQFSGEVTIFSSYVFSFNLNFILWYARMTASTDRSLFLYLWWLDSLFSYWVVGLIANPRYLHSSEWVIIPIPACLFLYSFWINLILSPLFLQHKQYLLYCVFSIVLICNHCPFLPVVIGGFHRRSSNIPQDFSTRFNILVKFFKFVLRVLVIMWSTVTEIFFIIISLCVFTSLVTRDLGWKRKDTKTSKYPSIFLHNLLFPVTLSSGWFQLFPWFSAPPAFFLGSSGPFLVIW